MAIFPLYLTIYSYCLFYPQYLAFLFFLSFFSPFFKGHTHGIWRFPGVELELLTPGRPTPGPGQLKIRAASVTYTTAQGNASSLTHWARLGIEPTTPRFLLGFVSTAPQQELRYLTFLNAHIICILLSSNCLISFQIVFNRESKSHPHVASCIRIA